jgi:hypothetical protein
MVLLITYDRRKPDRERRRSQPDIPFVAHHTDGLCDGGYISTLKITEATTAVVLAISVHPDPGPAKSLPPGMACAFDGQNTPRPSDTRTITLAQRLGNRVGPRGDRNAVRGHPALDPSRRTTVKRYKGFGGAAGGTASR